MTECGVIFCDSTGERCARWALWAAVKHSFLVKILKNAVSDGKYIVQIVQ